MNGLMRMVKDAIGNNSKVFRRSSTMCLESNHTNASNSTICNDCRVLNRNIHSFSGNVFEKTTWAHNQLPQNPTNYINRFERRFFATIQDKMSNREVIAVSEAKRFITDCFVVLKTPTEHAELMADLLVMADYRGHFSHGMNRLEMYLNDLLVDSMDGAVVPKILKETPATAWVDGCNGLGAVVGRFCMDLAIKKAKIVGVGWVCAKRSNHYGIAGWHSIYAEQQGLIGISMTNTSPLMCPTRSIESALGTNPISLAAPANNGDSFVLDMATTAVAVGKIELQRRKGEPIPSGWAQGPDGNITTDANVAFDTACLMPVGGSEITSGYKGYGLGALVEILCGVSADADFATKVRKWTLTGAQGTEANMGQVFIAVDPDCFAPGFTDRMTEMNGILRNLTPAEKEKPVLVAGDPERIHMAKVDKDGGIRYHVNQIKNCDALAHKFSVRPLGSS